MESAFVTAVADIDAQHAMTFDGPGKNLESSHFRIWDFNDPKFPAEQLAANSRTALPQVPLA